MRILMLGDLVGKCGRDAAQQMLPTLREMYGPHFVIVNGENAAAGHGITPDIARQLLDTGVDAITLGNHTWNRREIMGYLDEEPRILRPANFPPGLPGRGYRVFAAANGVQVGVANLQGRYFLDPLDDPFRLADTILDSFHGQAQVSFFDFHAEATSEKLAFGFYVDGRAGAVVGTHTHIQTADERLLPHGTAYISDVGMCGPQNSVIGMAVQGVLNKFVTQVPQRLEVADGPVVLCGVIVDIDPDNGRATHIERIQIRDIY